MQISGFIIVDFVNGKKKRTIKLKLAVSVKTNTK